MPHVLSASHEPGDRLAGWLSIAAGAVHGGLGPRHFDEWWGYGLFFIAAAAGQVLFGLALLLGAIQPSSWGPGWRVAKDRLLAAGIAGNVAIVALYIVTRTVGIPFFGPEAGETEPVAPIDVVSKALESGLIVALAVRVWRPRR